MQLGLVVCTAVLAVYLALRQSGFEADHNAFGVPPGSSLNPGFSEHTNARWEPNARPAGGAGG